MSEKIHQLLSSVNKDAQKKENSFLFLRHGVDAFSLSFPAAGYKYEVEAEDWLSGGMVAVSALLST